MSALPRWLVSLLLCAPLAVGAAPGRLALAATTVPGASLAFIAEARGYFAAEGVEVELLRFESGNGALAAVASGQAELGTSADMPVVYAIRKGQPIRVVASLASSTKTIALLARREAGVAAVADLRGKRVGFASGTSGEFFLDTILQLHGLTAAAVQRVNMPMGEMVAAMREGRVDAVVAWAPYRDQVLSEMGDRLVRFDAGAVLRTVHLLSASAAALQSRGPEIRKVIRALLRADDLVRQHPAEAWAALQQTLGEAAARAADQEYTIRMTLDPGLIPLLEEEARWAGRAAGEATAIIPDFRSAIDHRPLASERATAVRLIRRAEP